MAKVINDSSEMTQFLRDYNTITEDMRACIEMICNDFNSYCEGWQGQTRVRFETDLEDFTNAFRQFLNETEEDKALLQRLIRQLEEIGAINIRRG